MKLDDPFGRLSQKHEIQYQSLRNSLKEAGVNTCEEVEASLAKMKKNSVYVFTAVILTILLTGFFLPQFIWHSIIFGVLIIIWLVITSLNAQRLFRRLYMMNLTRINRCTAPVSYSVMFRLPEA